MNLRNIQMYEQRVNGIDKAQANILYKLSCVLGCNVEDLLEKPHDVISFLHLLGRCISLCQTSHFVPV